MQSISHSLQHERPCKCPRRRPKEIRIVVVEVSVVPVLFEAVEEVSITISLRKSVLGIVILYLFQFEE